MGEGRWGEVRGGEVRGGDGRGGEVRGEWEVLRKGNWGNAEGDRQADFFAKIS